MRLLRAANRLLPAGVTGRLQRWRGAAAHLVAGAELHEAAAVAARELDAVRDELKGDHERLLQDLLQRQDTVLAGYDRRVAAAVNRLLDLEARLDAAEGEAAHAGLDANELLAAHHRSPRPPGHALRMEDKDRRDRLEARLARRIDLLRDHAPVLDLGGNGGVVLAALHDAGVTASGIDSDPLAVAELRQRGLVAHPGDVFAETAALGQASSGSVTMVALVERLDLGDVDRLLRSAHRVLRPGGVLLVDTTYPTSESAMADFWRDPTRVRPYDAEALRQVVDGAGFEVLEMRPDPSAPDDYELVARRP